MFKKYQTSVKSRSQVKQYKISVTPDTRHSTVQVAQDGQFMPRVQLFGSDNFERLEGHGVVMKTYDEMKQSYSQIKF